ncbi:hypothetical protein HYU96_02580, partial [Candidatus Daviesbacteria bacterium]|nr:hypothetical protein [Candidatus Daviesbacteria bacterium]
CWVGVFSSGNPKDGKRYWWKWDQCRTTNSGNFNASFNGTGSGCSASRAYAVQNTTPANLTVTGVPACSSSPYNVTLSWQNTNSTLWLDLSTNNFADFVNKNVSNQTSTQIPAGMAGVTLNANTTYQWRLYNGSTHTRGPDFFAPFCPARVMGRVYVDRNGNNSWDSAGEEFIKTGLPSDGSCSPSNPNFFMKDLQISYTGPVIWSNSVNGCNNQPGYGSAPFYDTNQIPIGTYTFRPTGALAGWRIPDPQTFTLASGETKQLWWGLNPPPANLTVDKPA